MPIHDWTRVDAGIFHDFHHDWIFTLKGALNQGLLPADYYALAEQIAGGLHPDVLTLERDRPASTANGGTGAAPGACLRGRCGLGRGPAGCPLHRLRRNASVWAQRDRIAIRHVSADQVVAIIEIVSPGNKAGRHALRAFVQKALEFLDDGVHLLLLDLFPPGPRDPQGIHGALWSEIAEDDFHLPQDRQLTLASYSAGEVKRAFIEPVAVGVELPAMPLFLEPEFYVPVPLEATYQAAFDAVPKRWRDELE